MNKFRNQSLSNPRRKFIKNVLAVLAALIATRQNKAFGTIQGQHGHGNKNGNQSSPRWGMVIDLDKCTACGACVVACAQENNQMLGSPEEAEEGRIIRWLKMLPVNEGEYPKPQQTLLPMPCQHCDRPPCIKVCPVYATFKNEEGIVGQVYARCIGCRYCLNACPYTCKFFNWKKQVWPASMENSFNPNVSVRPKGVVEKCLFCHHRLQVAKEKAKMEGRSLKETDYQPACAEICPTKAIVFGNLNNPESKVSNLVKLPRAFHLLEELGTEPKVTYLRKET